MPGVETQGKALLGRWEDWPWPETSACRDRVPRPTNGFPEPEEEAGRTWVKMGFVFSKSRNDIIKNQQEFMVMNSRLQLERQILMQNQMRERVMATNIAWTREFLKYFGTFTGLAAVGLTIGAVKKKKPGLFLPLVPLSFILVYQYDMGYGSLLQRIKSEAENILDSECSMLEMPKGPITFEDIEKARRAQSKFVIEK
nr:plasminogen receptor (KT) isoform X2 [Pogona vitticeps]